MGFSWDGSSAWALEQLGPEEKRQWMRNGGMRLAGLLGLSWDVVAVHEQGWMAWFRGQSQGSAGFGAALLIARTTWCPARIQALQQGSGPATTSCLRSAGQAALLLPAPFGKHLEIPFPAHQETSDLPSWSNPLPLWLRRVPEEKTFTNTPRF